MSSRLGTITEFDEVVGCGMVRASTGESYPFHCTAITDGSRTIDVGTTVSFEVVAARDGAYEATAVNKGAS